MFNTDTGNYVILSNLYALYQAHSDDESTLKVIANIAWALEFDLKQTNNGFMELSELAQGHIEDTAKNHYIEVIDSALQRLQGTK